MSIPGKNLRPCSKIALKNLCSLVLILIIYIIIVDITCYYYITMHYTLYCYIFNYIFIKIIVESNAFVKNQTKKYHVHFTQFSTMVNILQSCNIKAQLKYCYYYINLIQISPVLLILICVYVSNSVQFYHISRCVYLSS